MLPYATSPDLKIGGTLKREPEDFQVTEIPAYEPCGSGEHLFLYVEKRDVSADFLKGRLARALGCKREDIGMAGLKDRQAVTRQWVSVPAEFESSIEQIDADDIRVLKQSRHSNKLKTGHLRGNRFEILVRDPFPIADDSLAQLVETVNRLGVPNYYGEQRFGHDGETLQLGIELLNGDKIPADIPRPKRKFLTRFAVSAVQSEIFNRVLAGRITAGTLHQVQRGDVMQVVASGGMFLVQEVATEQARYDAREIVPTGPMFGPKMKASEESVLETELAVLNEVGLSPEHFKKFKKLTSGTRRPLLLWPDDLSFERCPEGSWFRFELPRGAYATVVLREFMKTE